MSPLLTAHLSDIPLQNLYKLLQPITVPHTSDRARFCNWGRAFYCTPLAVFEPETELQCELILELARREGKRVRAVGVGHSPSDLACTSDLMMRTDKLNKIIEINSEKRYVIAQGGITLYELHAELAKHNLAMICIGSISDQTLAGVISTASHGSGVHYGVISTQVMAITLLLADGSYVTCSRSDHSDLFMATLCGLGATGLILSIQLEVEPAFHLKEIQESQPFDVVMKEFDGLAASAEHVRFWWFPSKDVIRCSYSDRTQEPKNPAGSWWWHSLLGHHLMQLLLFLGRFFLALNTMAANFACWLISGKSVGIDDGHRIFNVDCRYPQFTTEWAIPFDNAKSCIEDLRSWLKREYDDPYGLRPHFPIEIRFSSADDIWLSPSFGQRTCWIGIVQYKPFGYNVPYRKLFHGFETIMSRHQGRPHWAKAHHLQSGNLRKLYPHFDDFVRTLEKYDSYGLFRSEYIQRHIFGMPINGRFFKLRR